MASRRTTHLFLMSLLVIALAGALLARPVLAAEPTSENAVTIIVADGTGIRETEGGVEMTRSFIALVAAVGRSQPLAFIDAERPSAVFGPAVPGDTDFDDLTSAVWSELASGTRTDGGLFAAVAEAGSLLGLERAGVGSTIYLVMGATSPAGDEDLSALISRLTPVIDRMAGRGIQLHVVTIGNPGAELARFAADVAVLGGGSVLDIGTPAMLQGVARSLLARAGRGTMDVIGESRLTDGEVMSTAVDIVPGTEEVQLVLFKDDPSGSLRLITPDGVEARPGNGELVRVESPYVVAWRILQPTAGSWRLESSGVGGSVSVWAAQANAITLTLETTGPIPTGEAVGLVARVESAPRFLAGAEVFAHLTTPTGKTLTYRLTDDGQGADAVAGDGYLSASIAPLAEPGVYDVVLEMGWEGLEYRITSQSTIRAQAFPSLDVTKLFDDELTRGERTLVASALVNVDGQPYPVATSAIRWEVSGADVGQVEVDIEPRQVSSAGEGWMFDVYVTVSEPGVSALTLRLDVDYVGRRHVSTSESLVVSVPSPAAAPAPEPASLETPTARPVEESTGFPWWVLTFPGLLVVLLVGVGLRWLLAAAPAGYLYNDRNECLVDFSTLRRDVLARILSRGAVAGRELGVPGLDAVTFVFGRSGVSVRPRGSSVSVRVDSKPLSREARLSRRSWIGAGGRAYSFLLDTPAT